MLPRAHRVTPLIFEHAVTQNLLISVHQEFWPLDARNTARRVVTGAVYVIVQNLIFFSPQWEIYLSIE